MGVTAAPPATDTSCSLSALQTANFSAVLVAPSVVTTVTHPSQLYGKPVAMAPMNAKVLEARFGVVPRDASINTGESILENLARVARGENDAIIYNWPVLVWGMYTLRSTPVEGQQKCLVLLAHKFLPRNAAFAFAKGFPAAYVKAVDDELVRMDDDGAMAEKRLLAWEGLAENGTMTTCREDDSGTEIYLRDVWVLFVILGGFGLMAIIMACWRVKRAPAPMLHATATGTPLTPIYHASVV
jgi:hypothetical protein